jgi:predicted dehydrogenase
MSGKDVYVEKPASHVFREGQLLVNAARKNKRIVQHGTQMRSSPVLAEAAEVLKSGVPGEIKIAKAWNVQDRGFAKPVPDSQPPAGVDYDRWLGFASGTGRPEVFVKALAAPGRLDEQDRFIVELAHHLAKCSSGPMWLLPP